MQRDGIDVGPVPTGLTALLARIGRGLSPTAGARHNARTAVDALSVRAAERAAAASALAAASDSDAPRPALGAMSW